MGWLGKALGFGLAIFLLDVGAWQLALLVLAFLFIPPILRVRSGGRKSEEKGRARPRAPIPVRYVLGATLILGAAYGIVSGGTFSPLLFGALGALVLLWGRVRISAAAGLRPVEESILLRSSPFPVYWAAVAEVKPLTRDVGRALASVAGTVLVAASEKPAIYLMIERQALTEKSAEEEIIGALREDALALSALGAYLLPLDSKEAAALLQPSLEACKSGTQWSVAAASGGYDFLLLKQDRGFTKSLEFYRKVDEGQEGRAKIPVSPRHFPHPPFLTEVYKAIGSRLTWPQPDQRTAFLGSLLATSNEPIGTRVVEAGEGSQSQMVLVRSQGSPPVELSRAQLRAVVKMYDRGLGSQT